MAEQFLNRLTAIEKNIAALDETLKRMVSIMTTFTEIRAEVKLAKQEILEALKSRPMGEDTTKATEELVSLMVTEMQAIKDQIITSLSDISASGLQPKAETGATSAITSKIDQLSKSITESMEAFKIDVMDSIQAIARTAETITASAPPVSTPRHTTVTEPEMEVPTHAAASRPSSLPADKAMKIAENLEKVVQSLKMGCLAGDVIDTMTSAKAEIMKFVSSDQILVKIDKWVGSLGSYSRRHEVQAKDIVRLKKEIRDEISKYAPA